MILSGMYPTDSSVSVGDVVMDLMSKNHPEKELIGISDGYITSVDGLASGIFGGWDGWLYLVKYGIIGEDGLLRFYTDIPSVGIYDYKIKTVCQIVLYYGDFDDSFAGYSKTENGMIKLVSYTPVYDENYTLVSFNETPLAGGSFDLKPVITDKSTSEVTLGKTISFKSDENGLTKLDYEFRAVPNGIYYGSVGKQSDVAATVNNETITKPEVVRYSSIFIIDNKPLYKEIFKKKVELLLIGMRYKKH
jgi:hypothetical protein